MLTVAIVLSENRPSACDDPQLARQIRREAARAVGGDDVGAAEVAVQRADFPTPRRVVAEAERRQIERLAVEIQRRRELLEVHPAFLAARHLHLEPLGAPLQQRDLLAALGYEEHRVAAAGPRVQLDVRIGDRHLAGLPFCACRRSCDGELAERQNEQHPPHLHHRHVEWVVVVLRADVEPLGNEAQLVHGQITDVRARRAARAADVEAREEPRLTRTGRRSSTTRSTRAPGSDCPSRRRRSAPARRRTAPFMQDLAVVGEQAARGTS